VATFVLILLLIAAIFGVLGAVLKIALVLVLGLILGVTLLVWGTWWWLRRRMRDLQREFDRRAAEDGRRRRAIDVRHVPNESEASSGHGPLELEDRTPSGEGS
jgi:uncharacterized protein (DUF58 family)